MTITLLPVRDVRVETTDDIVRAAAAKFRGCIRGAARRLANGDRELRRDLEQEALILLWELDPTRFDENDGGYLRKAIRQRMRRIVLREQRSSGRGGRIGSSPIYQVPAPVGRPMASQMTISTARRSSVVRQKCNREAVVPALTRVPDAKPEDAGT